MRPRSALLLLLAVACAHGGAPDGERAGAPLFDDALAPDVLVESRTLEPPPSTAGNRFLTGWRAAARGNRNLLLADAAGARIEGVSLGDGPRRLVLALAPGALPAGFVTARVAGAPAVRAPLGARVELPLPPRLPRGRFVVDLLLPADAPPLRGGFDRALPAGEARVAGGDLVQGGVSLVDLVRPLRGATTVTGTFLPPAAPRGGQRFELVQRCGARERTLWRWTPSLWDRLRPPRLRVAVRCADGWLRLRFVAATPGPPATWRGLTVTPAGAIATAASASSTGDAAGAAATPSPHDGDAAAAVAPASPPQLVVLFVFDALRADAVGAALAGASATPELDRLSGSGVRFARHFAVAPNTLPSTKALLTGHVWKQQGGVPLGPDLPTLAERFRAAGYRTGLFSGSVYVSPTFGVGRGFETAPADTLLPEDAGAGAATNRNAEQVTTAALAWLRALPPGARAFVYLHVIHPHNPYAPPAPFAARAATPGSTLDGSTATLLGVVHQRVDPTAADRARIHDLYLANLAYADHQLGAFVDALAARWSPRETLLVATADHGEELFDHGGLLHGYTLYDEQLHIPLLLRWPGVLPAAMVTTRTATTDLHAALAALAAGRDAHRALAALLAGGGDEAALPHMAAASSVRGGIFAARGARYEVVWAPRTGIQWGMGEGRGRVRDAEWVFDLARDPAQRTNLAGIDAPEVLWLRERLLAWARRPERAVPGGTEPADEETRARLRALGYVQ